MTAALMDWIHSPPRLPTLERRLPIGTDNSSQPRYPPLILFTTSDMTDCSSRCKHSYVPPLYIGLCRVGKRRTTNQGVLPSEATHFKRDVVGLASASQVFETLEWRLLLRGLAIALHTILHLQHPWRATATPPVHGPAIPTPVAFQIGRARAGYEIYKGRSWIKTIETMTVKHRGLVWAVWRAAAAAGAKTPRAWTRRRWYQQTYRTFRMKYLWISRILHDKNGLLRCPRAGAVHWCWAQLSAAFVVPANVRSEDLAGPALYKWKVAWLRSWIVCAGFLPKTQIPSVGQTALTFSRNVLLCNSCRSGQMFGILDGYSNMILKIFQEAFWKM